MGGSVLVLTYNRNDVTDYYDTIQAYDYSEITKHVPSKKSIFDFDYSEYTKDIPPLSILTDHITFSSELVNSDDTPEVKDNTAKDTAEVITKTSTSNTDKEDKPKVKDTANDIAKDIENKPEVKDIENTPKV